MKAGSSPRVRGPDPQESRRRSSRRFIPACAGTSSTALNALSVNSVHPRVCGDQPGDKKIFQRPDFFTGSSPRVRGPVCVLGPRARFCRFIPACAGTSDQFLAGGFAGAVHPRVCGDQE